METTNVAVPAAEVEPSSLTAMPEHGSTRHHYAAFVVMLALAVAAPFGVYPVFLAKVLCFALFACAFNLLIGYGGLLSFGHAAFWGTAAYASAHFASKGLAIDAITIFKISIPLGIALPPFRPEFAILASVVVAAIFGYIIGKLAIRRQGIYFAMVTL